MNARKHTFGKEIMEPMSAIMFFNCCQRACETCTSKATPRMIRCKHVASTGSSGCPKRDGAVLTIYNGTPKSSKGSCGRTTPRRQYGDSELVEAARYANLLAYAPLGPFPILNLVKQR